jgi:hypothetical protein
MFDLSYDLIELLFEYLNINDKMNLVESGLIDHSCSSIIFNEIRKSKKHYVIQHHSESFRNGGENIFTCILDSKDAVYKYITKIHDQFHEYEKHSMDTICFKRCSECDTTSNYFDEEYYENCDDCMYLSDIKCDQCSNDNQSIVSDNDKSIVSDDENDDQLIVCNECRYINSIKCENDVHSLVCDDCIFCENCVDCMTYLKISQKLDFEFIYKKCRNRVCCSKCKQRMTYICCKDTHNEEIWFSTHETSFISKPNLNGILYDNVYNV